MTTPKEKGYYFPAEWHPQTGTWLSFPVNKETWENRFERIYPSYFKLIKTIAEGQKVKINVDDIHALKIIEHYVNLYEINSENIEIFPFKTNDSWCRDHGPAFLVNKNDDSRVIVDWEYNAWGEKYPPFDSDNAIPQKIAAALKLPFYSPGIVMEGGAVEFNGNGTVLTSRSCLLNKNRNPHLSETEIEGYLRNYYGVDQVLWVNEGVDGDDTDGHIDDIVRFVNSDSVITMVETNKKDENHKVLAENLSLLKKMRLTDGKQLNVIEIQMPKPVYSDGLRLPASYANFLITNKHVIVPTFNCDKDAQAIDILQSCFKDREVTGIDSTEIIWGLGSFHCLSQQEPAPNNFDSR